MAAWAPWNPAAGFFHAVSRNTSFGNEDVIATGRGRRSRSKRAADAPPAGVRLGLPVPDARAEFPRVLLGRRTWRRFGSGSLDVESVGSLLWLTAAVHAWLVTPEGDRLPLKTSPSGGARHPIDVFALLRNVAGCAPGLYRYDPEHHQLESLGRPGPTDVQVYLPSQYWYNDAGMLVFLSARFERTMQRYKYPRAYRTIMIEAGHICQTFCLSATWLGLAPFSTMALDDSAIEKDLGLDGTRDSVLYVAGAGVRAKSGIPAAPRDVKRVKVLPHTVRPARPRGKPA